MVHIGSFIPAEEAVVGLFDRIFTRIHTRESVSANMSSFFIDINQIAVALHTSTERSIVLLDEFGKGTATIDGIALLVATVQHFFQRKKQCPFLLITTHFHDVLRQKLLIQSEALHFLTMDAITDNCEDIICLYQLYVFFQMICCNLDYL